jgi:hypothetical protein
MDGVPTIAPEWRTFEQAPASAPSSNLPKGALAPLRMFDLSAALRLRR